MRLLNTPIIGISPTMVANSWIDMLAGLAGLASRRMPPRFCAQAGWPAESANSSETTARQRKHCFTMLSSLCSWLGPVKARDNRAVPPDLLRRRFVACFLESRNAVEPRLCRLQLRGKRQQGRFFAVAAREMYTDRQTIRRPVQRHAHRRRAGCVMQRCHRQIFRDAFGEGLNIAVLVEISEFRGRSGQRR